MAFIRKHRLMLVPLFAALAIAAGLVLALRSQSEEPAGSGEPGGGDPPTYPRVTARTWQEVAELRNDHTREWKITTEIERLDPETDEVVTETTVSRVREVASSLCYKDGDGPWQPSVPEWEATATGFKADRNNYQVYFGTTLGVGYAKVVSGKVFWMRPRSLVLSDGVHMALVAEIDPTATAQVDANDPAKLVFVGAFGEGLDAGLEYVLEKASFHQNVVLRAPIALPNGFDPETTQLYVFTQIGLDNALAHNTVSVRYAREAVVSEADGSLTPFSRKEPIAFRCTDSNEAGRLETRDLFAFAPSRVFDSAETVQDTLAERNLWRDPRDRQTYLVERVPHAWLAAATYPITLDYETRSGSIDGQVWRADATYHVSGDVNVALGKTLTIEPGTVVKFASGTAINVITEDAKIVAKGEPYSYIVFTSDDDNNSGQEIAGSDGTPNLGDYDDAIVIGLSASADCEIEYCKIGYASDAIEIDLDIGTIKHCIIRNCQDGIVIEEGSAPDAFNCLLYCSSYGLRISPDSGQFSLSVTNCTFNHCTYGLALIPSGYASISVTAKNNLFTLNSVGVLKVGGTCTLDYNGWWANGTDVSGASKGSHEKNLIVSPYNHDDEDPDYPYNPCPLGEYYIDTQIAYGPPPPKGPPPPLPGGYLLVNAGYGTANSLYGDGSKFDIKPPDTVDADISGSVTWQKHSGDTSTVDIGYHQPRIDKLIDDTTREIDSGATLAIDPGVVVAFHGEDALLQFDPSASVPPTLVCNGTPANPIIVSGKPEISMSVEAQNGRDWSYVITGIRLNKPSSTNAYASITYTRFIGLDQGVEIAKDSVDEVAHCVFERGQAALLCTGADDRQISVFNCLFRYNQRGIVFDGNDGTPEMSVRHCTFHGNGYGLLCREGDSGATYIVNDCLFSSCDYGVMLDDAMPSTFTHDYNAFYECGDSNGKKIWRNYTPTGEEDIGPNSLDMSDSPYDVAAQWDWPDLWHLDQDGACVGAGSQRAVDAGLGAFTTDYASGLGDAGQVDIGYHYDADSDGDGMTNSWELSHELDPFDANDADDDPDGDGLTNLEEYGLGTDPMLADTDGDGITDDQDSNPTIFDHKLPYWTSFEEDEGYAPGDLAGQYGWTLEGGSAAVVADASAPNGDNSVALSDAAAVKKTFTGTNDGIWHVFASIKPAPGSAPNLNDVEERVAVIYFNSGGTGEIMCLDGDTSSEGGGTWVTTGVACNGTTWYDIHVVLDYGSETWDVYVNDSLKLEDLGFRYSEETSLNVFRAFGCGSTAAYIDDVCIADSASPSIQAEITSPSTTDYDDYVEGVVEITGTAFARHLDKYQILLDPQEPDDLDPIVIHEGYTPRVDVVLDLWHTTTIPNGTYGLQLKVIDEDTNYSTDTVSGIVVSGALKSGAFSWSPEPDISVPFKGLIPFELRRTYSSSTLISKPFWHGWTYSYDIRLQEDCDPVEQHPITHQWSTDEDLIAYGPIIVTYPDGSRQLFRVLDEYGEPMAGQIGGDPVIYRPYPDRGTNEEVWREKREDWPGVYWLNYTLKTHDGTEYQFREEGTVEWEQPPMEFVIETSIDQIRDRFGNSIYISDNSISDGSRTISLTRDGNGRITSAAFSYGGVTYRQVEYEWDGVSSTWNVHKKGKGVNSQGVKDEVQDTYTTSYVYDSANRIVEIINPNETAGTENPIVENTYEDGLLVSTKHYISDTQYDETVNDYNYNLALEHVTTTVSSGTDIQTFQQNYDGALTETEQSSAEGGAPVVSTSSQYIDGNNPLLPTSTTGTYDGADHLRVQVYEEDGDPDVQQLYKGDSQTDYQQIEYDTHPIYGFTTRTTTYQDYARTQGTRVETRNAYGYAYGTLNENGKYLVAEGVLLSADGGSELLWTTSHTYYDDGTVAGTIIPRTEYSGDNVLWSYTYDNNGYRTFSAVDGGGVARYLNDDIGNVVLDANDKGGVTRRDYDDFGRMWKVRLYADADGLTRGSFTTSYYDGLTPISTTTYGYDKDGNRTKEISPLNDGIDHEFFLDGKLKKTTYSNGSYVEHAYNDNGTKASERRYDDGLSQARLIKYKYDALGRLTEEECYDFDETTVLKRVVTEYYDTGQAKSKQVYGLQDTEEVLELETAYAYDEFGRLLESVVDPDGLALTTAYEYDAFGNKAKETDPNGSMTYYSYDNANRMTEEYFPAAPGTSKANAKLRFAYDYFYDGNTKKVTEYDNDGSTVLATTEYEYDGQDRITEVTQRINDTPTYAVTQISYTFTGTPKVFKETVTDAESKDTVYTYDGLGRLARIDYPDGQYVGWSYTADGQIDTQIVFEGANERRIDFDYYANGWLQHKKYYGDYPPGSPNRITYGYDGFGNRTAITDDRASGNIGGDGEISFTWDALGRMASKTDQDDYTIEYEYYATGARKRITVEDSTPSTVYDVDYEYDAANRLEEVYETAGARTNLATYGYDDNGSRTSLDYYEPASTTSYEYDRANRLTLLTSTLAGPTTLCAFDYDDGSGSLDGLGRRTWVDEALRTTGGGTVTYELTHQYDDLSRLTRDRRDRTSGTPTTLYDYDFSYDDAGNRTAVDATSYSYYADSDKLSSDGTNSYQYDDNGNTTDKGSDSFGWDYDNRLVEFDPNVGSTVSYVYDPDGNLVRRTVDSTTTTYVVDTNGELPVVLLDRTSAATTATYVYGDDLLCFHDGDLTVDRHYYFYDGLGSVRLVTDDAGAVENRTSYEAFGTKLTAVEDLEETVANPYGFTGERRDPASGLVYLRARYYDALTGRFWSMDPVKGDASDPPSLHKYLYCQGDPVNCIDPTGLFNIPILGGIAAHAQISLTYLSEHLFEDVDCDVPIGEGFLDRPDIANHSRLEVYEIKPNTQYGWDTGPKQLDRYIDRLSSTRGTTYRGGSWPDGTREQIWLVGPLLADLVFWNEGPGIIYYEYEPRLHRLLYAAIPAATAYMTYQLYYSVNVQVLLGVLAPI